MGVIEADRPTHREQGEISERGVQPYPPIPLDGRRGGNWTVTLVFLALIGMTVLMALLMRLVFSSFTS